MARKSAPDRKPYRPVDEAFVRNTPTIFRTPERGGETSSESEEQGAARPVVKAVPKKTPPIKLTKYARYLTTDDEFRELQRFTSAFSKAAGTTIELGKLIRACNAVLLDAEEELLKEAQAAAPLKRPRNDDPVGLADFEQKLTEILSAAFHKAKPL
jgi:hypothetical protein